MKDTKNIILCVDDDATILRVLKAEIKSFFAHEYVIEEAQSGSEAIDLIDDIIANQHQIPLIISDYLMPQMRGDEFLKHAHEKLPDTIKIMLTGQATVEGVANAIAHAQLYRYISKPWQREDLRLTIAQAIFRYFQAQEIKRKTSELEALTFHQAKLIDTLKHNELRLEKLNNQLSSALQSLINLKSQNVQQQERNQELAVLLHTDSLTRIANRRHLDSFLQKEWDRAMQMRWPLAFGLVDIDWFKKYNDFYGHQAGDDCLYGVAQFLQTCIRQENDLVARYGGEEFALIFPGIDGTTALHKANSLCQGLGNLLIEHQYSPFKIMTISIGVTAFIPTPEFTVRSLVELADKALYEAKASGRNQAKLNLP